MADCECTQNGVHFFVVYSQYGVQTLVKFNWSVINKLQYDHPTVFACTEVKCSGVVCVCVGGGGGWGR
jgi:hypothetical protein